MPSKLTIYNGALTILGERKLTDLTENREPRWKLDTIWDNEFVDRVLQLGQWNFAQRTVQLEYSPSITPSFGYQYAFDKPLDFIRTLGLCHDEYFTIPITRYSDESAWIFTDAQIIYLKYVSNDVQWGGDYSLWPANFTEFAEHYLAYKVGPTLAGMNFNERELERKQKTLLLEAKSTDAMEQPAKFAPKGGWAQSRQGFRSSGDRGSRSKLIG